MTLMRSYNRQGASHRDGLRFGRKVGQSVEDGGLVEYFFGKDGSEHLQYDKFSNFLNQLHDEVCFLLFILSFIIKIIMMCLTLEGFHEKLNKSYSFASDAPNFHKFDIAYYAEAPNIHLFVQKIVRATQTVSMLNCCFLKVLMNFFFENTPDHVFH
jgi:hypothetical protein